MKRTLIITVVGAMALMLGLPTFSFSQTKEKGDKKVEQPSKAAASNKMEQEILQAMNARREALMRGDGEALGRLLADDYVVIGTSGIVSTKQEVLAGYKTMGNQNNQRMEHTDHQVRVYGNTAVVIYLSTYKRNVGGPGSKWQEQVDARIGETAWAMANRFDARNASRTTQNRINIPRAEKRNKTDTVSCKTGLTFIALEHVLSRM